MEGSVGGTSAPLPEKAQGVLRFPRGGRKLSAPGSRFSLRFLFLLYPPEGRVLTSVTKIKSWIYCRPLGWFLKSLDRY